MIYLYYSPWLSNNNGYIPYEISVSISQLKHENLLEFYCSERSAEDFFINDTHMEAYEKEQIFNYMYENYPELLTIKWSFPILPTSCDFYKQYDFVKNVVFMNNNYYHKLVNNIDYECNKSILNTKYMMNQSLLHKVNDIYVYPYDLNLMLSSLKSKIFQVTSLNDVKQINHDDFQFRINMNYRYAYIFEIEDKNLNYLKLDSDFMEKYYNEGVVYENHEEFLDHVSNTRRPVIL